MTDSSGVARRREPTLDAFRDFIRGARSCLREICTRHRTREVAFEGDSVFLEYASSSSDLGAAQRESVSSRAAPNVSSLDGSIALRSPSSAIGISSNGHS